MAAAAALPAVLAVLRDARRPLSLREVQVAMEATKHTRDAVRAALKTGTRDGLVAVEDGPRGTLRVAFDYTAHEPVFFAPSAGGRASRIAVHSGSSRGFDDEGPGTSPASTHRDAG
jgi:hypothetical protein